MNRYNLKSRLWVASATLLTLFCTSLIVLHAQTARVDKAVWWSEWYFLTIVNNSWFSVSPGGTMQREGVAISTYDPATSSTVARLSNFTGTDAFNRLIVLWEIRGDLGYSYVPTDRNSGFAQLPWGQPANGITSVVSSLGHQITVGTAYRGGDTQSEAAIQLITPPSVSFSSSPFTNLQNFLNGNFVDADVHPQILLNWGTGLINAARPLANAGYLFNYRSYASPNADELELQANITVTRNEQPFLSESYPIQAILWDAGDATVNKSRNSVNSSLLLNFANDPNGTQYRITISVVGTHIGYDLGRSRNVSLGSRNLSTSQSWEFTVRKSRRGDVNGDDCVDDADLLEVLFNFGVTGQNRADVNRDGIVDDADLLIVLFNFGSGC